MSKNDVLAVILSGGKSRRFGGDKATTLLGNKTLIEHTVDKLKNNFKEILIVTNDSKTNSNNKGLFYTKDIIEGHLGPLVGVLSAMEWVASNQKDYKWILTFPCDTPFFSEDLINKIINSKSNSHKKLFFLKSGEKRHNIFGLWSIELRERLRADIEIGDRKVEDWANKIGTEVIDINDDESFLNINTKEDLKTAEQKIK